VKFRYKIIIEYDGTNYIGWQKQGEKRSLQSALHAAICTLTCENVSEIYGAGRTDASVHALGQVAHFDLSKQWDVNKLISGINHFLNMNNDRIIVLHCEEVDNDFHARFSAISRRYMYRIIHNCPKKLCLERNRAWQIRYKLNLDNMREAAKVFIGYHDFTSFRSAQCQSSSALKTIADVEIITTENNLLRNFNDCEQPKRCPDKSGDDSAEEEIVIYVQSKSFLHNQIRIMVGQLKEVGLGECTVNDVVDILHARDRTLAATTAPACGLYFLGVKY
jgi:tRNA pseudouridine38-40 synthase